MEISEEYKLKRYRRFKNTERIIKYRKRIIKEKMDVNQLNYVQDNRLSKYNFTCNCTFCKIEKMYNEKCKIFKYKHKILKYKKFEEY